MKKFKTKKHCNYRLILFFVIILFFIIFIYLSFQKLSKNYDNFISYLLKDLNKDRYQISIVKNLDYLLNNYSFKEENKVLKNNIIYLYNTHNDENYIDDSNVFDACISFQKNLNKVGIKSIVEDKKVSDYLILGKKEYDISREFIKEKINQDFLYYIDIHRDSVGDTKITLNNKTYAKILFVLGLDNPNYLQNKELLLKMDKYLNENYPGLSRGILEKGGKGVDGVYNQDLKRNVLLFEIGGVENNLEEVNNSTEILSLMIYNLLGDDR